jgi:excisionase family DNA binding protein
MMTVTIIPPGGGHALKALPVGNQAVRELRQALGVWRYTEGAKDRTVQPELLHLLTECDRHLALSGQQKSGVIKMGVARENVCVIPILLTIPQAAERISVSVSTIRRKIASGILPKASNLDGSVRVCAEDLDRLVAPKAAERDAPKGPWPMRWHDRKGNHSACWAE